MTDPPARV